MFLMQFRGVSVPICFESGRKNTHRKPDRTERCPDVKTGRNRGQKWQILIPSCFGGRVVCRRLGAGCGNSALVVILSEAKNPSRLKTKDQRDSSRKLGA